MRYKFYTTYAFEDYYEHNMYWLKYSAAGRKVMTRHRLIILLVTAVWLLACYYSFKFTSGFYYAAAVTLLAGGAWQLLAKKFTRNRIKRALRRRIKERGTERTEDIFYDDGTSCIGGGITTEVRYADMEQVVLYKGRYFYFTVNKSDKILPTRSLIGQVTVEEFTDFLQSRGLTVKIVE